MQDSHIGGPSHKVSAVIIALLSLEKINMYIVFWVHCEWSLSSQVDM